MAAGAAWHVGHTWIGTGGEDIWVAVDQVFVIALYLQHVWAKPNGIFTEGCKEGRGHGDSNQGSGQKVLTYQIAVVR